jgi:hypothetical protein
MGASDCSTGIDLKISVWNCHVIWGILKLSEGFVTLFEAKGSYMIMLIELNS